MIVDAERILPITSGFRQGRRSARGAAATTGDGRSFVLVCRARSRRARCACRAAPNELAKRAVSLLSRSWEPCRRGSGAPARPHCRRPVRPTRPQRRPGRLSPGRCPCRRSSVMMRRGPYPAATRPRANSRAKRSSSTRPSSLRRDTTAVTTAPGSRRRSGAWRVPGSIARGTRGRAVPARERTGPRRGRDRRRALCGSTSMPS